MPVVMGLQAPGGLREDADCSMAPGPVAGHERLTEEVERVICSRGALVSGAPIVRLSKLMESLGALRRSRRSRRMNPTLSAGEVPCEIAPNEVPLKKNSETFDTVLIRM